ncbi:MAG: mycothione reductase, partial [Propionibacteriaceae bacterium]|nr:mycothione reductase [Propionibacteriaceae bacterium]
MRHFDFCVIGSGSGTSVVGSLPKSSSIALVDDNGHFGGTCLNSGCIPTKMFAYPADLAANVRTAAHLGLHASGIELDWGEVRERVFGRLDSLSENGLEEYLASSNVTVFRRTGVFTGPKQLRVGDEEITADVFVLAAGSRPRIPELHGAANPVIASHLHTTDDIMRLPELPKRLVIAGGGAVAAEMAHIFAAFGSAVTLVHRGERLLAHADEEVSEQFAKELAESVTLRLRQQITGFSASKGKITVETLDEDGIDYGYEGDQVLLALGRIPNGDLLNVEAAGVELDAAGRVVVDEYQRTKAPGVYALGDISSPKQLKHFANAQARVVSHNIEHPKRRIKLDSRCVPQAVFSRPQVAWVGLTEAEAATADMPYVSAVRPYRSTAHGWAMGDDGHFVKLLANPKTKKLIGAHIIGPDASNLLQPLTQIMSLEIDVRKAARGQYWIHPALSEVVENALLDLDV